MTYKSKTGKTNVPDVIPTPDIVGHARKEKFNTAILGCGPHRLPNGRNY